MLITNPYFSVELSEVQLNSIRDELKKILTQELQIEIVDLDNPHITISYVLGPVEESLIEQVAGEIIEVPFKTKITGVTSLDSSYYGGTIISVGLIHNDDFKYCQEFLKENFESSEQVKIREFRGGFKAHISLFVIKGLTEKEKYFIPRYIELCSNTLAGKDLYGEKFCMYNTEREKIFEKRFKV